MNICGVGALLNHHRPKAVLPIRVLSQQTTATESRDPTLHFQWDAMSDNELTQ
jgi:hypothetical protein